MFHMTLFPKLTRLTYGQQISYFRQPVQYYQEKSVVVLWDRPFETLEGLGRCYTIIVDIGA
jgi:hypothetical protein